MVRNYQFSQLVPQSVFIISGGATFLVTSLYSKFEEDSRENLCHNNTRSEKKDNYRSIEDVMLGYCSEHKGPHEGTIDYDNTNAS